MAKQLTRMNRREFLSLAGGGAVAAPLVSMRMPGNPKKGPPKALVFDAFPIFDPRPVAAVARNLFPEAGSRLMEVWRARQFEYQWLRAIGERYTDFWNATEDALVFSAEMLKLNLSAERRAKLMDAYLDISSWPEVPRALNALRRSGYRLGLLSNATDQLLERWIDNAGLGGVFEHVLSTDRIRSYKPDPRAYRLATSAFKLDVTEIAYVAFAGWDVAGARWFGYPTYWVNRANLPPEELGLGATTAVPDLSGLVEAVALAR